MIVFEGVHINDQIGLFLSCLSHLTSYLEHRRTLPKHRSNTALFKRLNRFQFPTSKNQKTNSALRRKNSSCCYETHPQKKTRTIISILYIINIFLRIHGQHIHLLICHKIHHFIYYIIIYLSIVVNHTNKNTKISIGKPGHFFINATTLTSKIPPLKKNPENSAVFLLGSEVIHITCWSLDGRILTAVSAAVLTNKKGEI